MDEKKNILKKYLSIYILKAPGGHISHTGTSLKRVYFTKLI